MLDIGPLSGPRGRPPLDQCSEVAGRAVHDRVDQVAPVGPAHLQRPIRWVDVTLECAAHLGRLALLAAPAVAGGGRQAGGVQGDDAARPLVVHADGVRVEPIAETCDLGRADVALDVRGQQPERHVAVEVVVGGAEHGAHAAVGDQGDQLVAPEPIANPECHALSQSCTDPLSKGAIRADDAAANHLA